MTWDVAAAYFDEVYNIHGRKLWMLEPKHNPYREESEIFWTVDGVLCSAHVRYFRLIEYATKRVDQDNG